MEISLEKLCESLRGDIKDIAFAVKRLMQHETFKGQSPIEDFLGQHAEMKANIMLSYHHLEDARMRLGKVMQQIQGGTSIFDREKK